MNRFKRMYSLVLVLILGYTLVFAACSPQKMPSPSQKDITFSGTVENGGAKVTVKGIEKDLEFSLDGKSYNRSGEFSCGFQTDYTVWVRRASSEGKAASDAVQKKFVSPPNPATFSAGPDPSQFETVVVTPGSAQKTYEYSVDGRSWQKSNKLAVENAEADTVTVYVRVQQTGDAVSVAAEISNVSYLKNPDTDSPEDFAIIWSSGNASGMDYIESNTDAAGLCGESTENNRSVKMYFTAPANGIVVRGPGGVAAWSADLKIDVEGADSPYDFELRYFKNAPETDPTRPAADYFYHGTVGEGEWQRVMFYGDWFSPNTRGWEIVAGTRYTFYFDNIVKYSEADLENANVGNYLIENSTSYQDYSKLNDAITQDMLVGGVESNMPSIATSETLSYEQLNFTQISSKGWGNLMGFKIAQPLVGDLTNFDGIRFSLWTTVLNRNPGNIPIYLAAPDADLAKLDDRTDPTPLYQIADYSIGNVMDWKINDTTTVLYAGADTVFITKADLIAAGYDPANLSNLTVIYRDGGSDFGVTGFRYMNFCAYRDFEPSIAGYDFDGTSKTLALTAQHDFEKELEYTVDGSVWQASNTFGDIGYASQLTLGVRIKDSDSAKNFPNYKKVSLIPDVSLFTATANEDAYGSTVITAPEGNYEYMVEGTGLWLTDQTINDITDPAAKIFIRLAASDGFPASRSVSIPCAVKVTEIVKKYESAGPALAGMTVSEGVYAFEQIEENWAYSNIAFELWNVVLEEGYPDADGVSFDIQIKGNWQCLPINIYLVEKAALAGYPTGMPAYNADDSIGLAGLTKVFEYQVDSSVAAGYNTVQTVKLSKAVLKAAGYSESEFENFAFILNGVPTVGESTYRITGIKISNIAPYTENQE